MYAEKEATQYDLFEKWITAYLSEDSERNKGNFFSMSGVGGCARKIAYSYLKYKQRPLSERSKRVFFHGKVFENYVRWKVKNNPYGIRWDKYQMELKIDNPPQIGHPEGIIWCDTITNLVNMLNGEAVNINPDKFSPHHLEIKSIAQAYAPRATYGYSYTCDKGIYVAYPDYIAQQQTYLSQMRDYGCDDTFFVYENKNTDHIHGECVPFMQAEFDKVQNRLKGIYDVILSGGLPDREYDNPDQFPCSWEHQEQKCSYYDYCYGGDPCVPQ